METKIEYVKIHELGWGIFLVLKTVTSFYKKKERNGTE